VHAFLEIPALRGAARLLGLELLLRAQALAQSRDLGGQRLDLLPVLGALGLHRLL
jgi:hypothetical protein